MRNIPYPFYLILLIFLLLLGFISLQGEIQSPLSTEIITPVYQPHPSSRFLSPVSQLSTQSPSIRPLADQKGIYLGTAVQSKLLETDFHYNQIIQKDFNIITPEDEMKMCVTWPSRNQFNFEKADRIIHFAQKHNLKVRGHTLLWHECIPDWVLKQNLSRQEARELLKTYIYTIVSRYRGQVAFWDVLNETASWKPLWGELIGDDYAELALRWAHEADPDALLFYNDYDIEGVNKKSDKVYLYLENLMTKGVPIHGVGFQTHFWMAGRPRPSPESVAKNIKRFNQLGLQVQITEMDVLTNTMFRSLEEEQAKVYYDMLRVCLDASKCTAFIMWGFSDRHTWYKYYLRQPWANPLIYDDRYRPKSAYFGLLQALQETNPSSYHYQYKSFPK